MSGTHLRPVLEESTEQYEDSDISLPLYFAREAYTPQRQHPPEQFVFSFIDETLACHHWHVYHTCKLAVRHAPGWQEALAHNLWGKGIFNPNLLDLKEIDAFTTDLEAKGYTVVMPTNGKYSYPSSNHVPKNFSPSYKHRVKTVKVKEYTLVDM